jgi:NADH-quinone oxidoreductase subunit N
VSVLGSTPAAAPMMVSAEAITLVAPLVITGLWALLVPLAGRALPDGWSRRVALVGIGLALAAVVTSIGAPELAVGVALAGEALVADRLALLLDAVVLVVVLALLACDERADGSASRHALVVLAGAGALLCAHAGDVVVLVVGLELTCLATAALLGRAGFRWLIGQGVAAALLWLGLGLMYGATGATRFGELVGRVSAVFLRWGTNTVQSAVELLQAAGPLPGGLAEQARDVAVTGAAPAMLFIPGLLLALAGLLARFGAVPMHGGLADVVGRAGTAGAGAALVVVRLAAAAGLLRLFVAALHAPRVVYAPYGWGTAVAAIAGVTAVVGAIAAARQATLRRLLGWAAVAHSGLALLGMVAAADFYAHAGARRGGFGGSDHVDWGQTMGDAAVAAVLLTLAIHALASLGLLAAHAAFDRGRGHVDLVGLGRRAPGSALAISVCLLGLAGAPPTGAFVARWALLAAGLEDSNVLVRVMLGLAVLAGAALMAACVRVLVALWASAPAERPATAAELWPRVTLAVLAAMVLGTGLFGQVSVEASRAAAKGAGLHPGSGARRALATSASDVR